MRATEQIKSNYRRANRKRYQSCGCGMSMNYKHPLKEMR